MKRHRVINARLMRRRAVLEDRKRRTRPLPLVPLRMGRFRAVLASHKGRW